MISLLEYELKIPQHVIENTNDDHIITARQHLASFGYHHNISDPFPPELILQYDDNDNNIIKLNSALTIQDDLIHGIGWSYRKWSGITYPIEVWNRDDQVMTIHTSYDYVKNNRKETINRIFSIIKKYERNEPYDAALHLK